MRAKEYKQYKVTVRDQSRYYECRHYATCIGVKKVDKEDEGYFIIELSPAIQDAIWKYQNGINASYWRAIHNLGIVEEVKEDEK